MTDNCVHVSPRLASKVGGRVQVYWNSMYLLGGKLKCGKMR